MDKATQLRRLAFLQENTDCQQILDEYHMSNFSEYVIRTGGDVNTVRVNGDKKDAMQLTYR